MFKQNEGMIDRAVRVLLGTVLLPAGLFLLGGLQGSLIGLVVAGLGGIGLFTGFTGFCLLYWIFGISTLELEKDLIARCKSMAAACQAGHPGAGLPCGPLTHPSGTIHTHQK